MGRRLVTATTLLFLPQGDTGFRWMRVHDSRLVAEGEGVPPLDADEQVLAVAPAEEIGRAHV